MEVMERLRSVAALTPRQTADWEYFKTTWDKTMAAATEEDWAVMFSEMMQQIVNDLTAGTTNALIICVHAQGNRESFRSAACFGGTVKTCFCVHFETRTD